MNYRTFAALLPALLVGLAAAQNTPQAPTTIEQTQTRSDSKYFYELYADAVWSRLTGKSTTQLLRAGYKFGFNQDIHFYFRNEQQDTTGTDLAYQYNLRGTYAGVGYRLWFPGNKAYFTTSWSVGISGVNQKQNDIRAGVAGYDEWSSEKFVTDVYGDCFYVDLAKDTYASLRFRPGRILSRDQNGRLWAYGILQGYASGKGVNGTENRIETGLGLGYLVGGKVTFNAEMRYGYSFRGTITDQRYWNPTFLIAGFFN